MDKRSVPLMSKGYALVVVLAAFCLTWFAFPVQGAEVSRDHYQAVRELEPVGYWPVDEGQGEVAYDRSGNENHGQILSVPWRDGLLDFENDVYQWIQIPHHDAYASPVFSMGGWVYSRREYDQRMPYGVLIMGQPFTPRPGHDGALAWVTWRGRLDNEAAMLRFRWRPGDSPRPSLIEVASGRENDAIGSVEREIELETGEWQHVIYTYDEAATGRLYINGRLAHAAKDVPYAICVDTPYAIGGGRWGTSNFGGIQSLDGSVQHMVLFDRTLEEEEVAGLYEATRPAQDPSPPEHPVKEPAPDLDELDEIIAKLQNEELAEADRAEAALALAGMGGQAVGALPELRAVLVSITERDGKHVPKVEDLLRNAVMRALLDIAPNNEEVRALLGETLAKPFFDVLDMSKSYLDDIRPLVEAGRYMDALEAHREHLETVPKLPSLSRWGATHTDEHLEALRGSLPLRGEYLDAYFSKGFPFSDAHYNAYSQLDVHDGTTFIPVVERVSFEEVERVFEDTLKDLTDEEPDPEGKWSRLKILEIAPDGSEREVLLGGPWLIYDARDEKNDGWGILVDPKGYIHLTGGQHNNPRRRDWSPGSWEKLGIASGETDSAEVMYWVSKEPNNIDSFAFIGDRGNPRSFGGWMNYMNFVRAPDGTPFLFGRGRTWSWAIMRYDADERRWTEMRGNANRMIWEHAPQANPDWFESLGGTVPYHGPGDGVVVAFQPTGYNYNRAWPTLVRGIRGVTFDRTGRMHLQMPILGVGKEGRITHGPVYAYSDDLGETFRRADGTPLRLPLTVNPIPDHDASIEHHSSKQWFDVWMSLIQEAGWNRAGGFDR